MAIGSTYRQATRLAITPEEFQAKVNGTVIGPATMEILERYRIPVCKVPQVSQNPGEASTIPA
jgi:hypothetical protein